MTEQADLAALRANQAHYAHPEAFDYITNAYHARRIDVASKLLSEYLPQTTDSPIILDIGPGGTSAVGRLKNQGFVRIAIDASSQALRRAEGFDVRCCADISATLPILNDSVDAIFCGELIEHLFLPQKLLSECYRVLKPSGIIVITTPNIATLQDRVRFLFGRAPRHINPLHDYIRLHIRPFTPELLERVIRDSGFILRSLRSNYVDFHIAGRRYNIPFVARIFPRLGGTIILVGAKPGF